MRSLLLFVALFGLALMPACSLFNNVGCSVESAASGAIASGVTHALNCANSTQVLLDVTALVAKTNICSMPASKLPQGQKGGTIASLICPTLASLATTEIGTTVPASWQCNPALASAGLQMALNTACNLIPF